VSFTVHATDAGSQARVGALVTRRGVVTTPAFMPVGTRASVTGLDPTEVAGLGAEIILANTYHLMLRPGVDALRRVGGAHRFMAWPGPILTDSGGFQIFSLAADRTIDDDGATFRGFVDHQPQRLTPERAIEVQHAIGSDIMMVLDQCLDARADAATTAAAMARTHRWAARCLRARVDPSQQLFAIVQGGVVPALRRESAAALTDLVVDGRGFDGFAIGGLAVGESRAEREDVTALTAALLPAERPRYLMGVGTPADLLVAIGAGVDMFDCILPTRLAWQGIAFTSTGRVRVTRGAAASADAALDAHCGCSTCARFSRAYLHHLFKASEPLGPRLLSVHNLHHYLALMAEARRHIGAGTYAAWARATLGAIDQLEHSGHRLDRGRTPPA
jgi:queuine tRNA-ribosyltransferase